MRKLNSPILSRHRALSGRASELLFGTRPLVIRPAFLKPLRSKTLPSSITSPYSSFPTPQSSNHWEAQVRARRSAGLCARERNKPPTLQSLQTGRAMPMTARTELHEATRLNSTRSPLATPNMTSACNWTASNMHPRSFISLGAPSALSLEPLPARTANQASSTTSHSLWF